MKKIIVIGAGIIGLSISYYLKKHNFDIAVIEKSGMVMPALNEDHERHLILFQAYTQKMIIKKLLG